ncbi:MAG: PilZ domain-containing protein [Candidatus Aminicenantes bacterium]|jgi:c-di-GMP-binding flagellar brake protein YcgR
MKIDLVFLLKAIKENENIYIYHKEGKRTLRYFSRFFQLDSKEHTITIDYPYVDGYTHKYPEAGDSISVVFHTAGFRFHFDTKVKEKVNFPTGKGIKIRALKIEHPGEILDGNRRSLFRAAVYLDKSIKVKYGILEKENMDEPGVQLIDHGQGGIEALMVDISENGTAIKVNRKINIAVGNRLKLVFFLEEQDKNQIEIEGVVRNIRDYPGTKIQVWGIEFIQNKTSQYKKALREITCYVMSRNQENISFFTVNQIVSRNPYVQKIVDNEVTEDFLKMLLDKQLPLTEEEYLESLVYVLKIEKFKTRAAEQLLMIPFSVKEKYTERMDANHRVAYYILMEALNNEHIPIIANIINNKYLPPEFLSKIAQEGNARMLRLLLVNKIKMIAYPEIIDVIEENPNLTSKLKAKIKDLKDSYLKDRESELIPQAEVLEDVKALMAAEDKKGAEAPEAVEKDEIKEKALKTLQKINQLNVQERVRLALSGIKSERMILAKDRNPFVVLAILENPQTTGEEILRIAQNEKLSKEVIARICENTVWMKDYSIMYAVLRHPNAQIARVSPFIKKLNSRDLQDLAENKHCNPVIGITANELRVAPAPHSRSA